MIDENTYLEMKRLTMEYEYSQLNKHFTTEQPYLEVITIVTDKKYNPKYGDMRKCKCGHPYHRHFDSYEKMENVGCKYCDCQEFEEE